MHFSVSALPSSIVFSVLPLLVSLVYGSVIPVSSEGQDWEAAVGDSATQNLTLRDDASQQLEKRFTNSRFTFYDAGLGACGRVNTNSDFIVALNAAQWAGGAHCFETITISFGGKTARATVMDLCPGCPFGGLDLTRGLFGFFANLDLGVISGSWDFGGSAPAPPRPTTTPRPTPTPAPRPPPTTARTTSRRTSTTTRAPAPTPDPPRTSTATRAPAPPSTNASQSTRRITPTPLAVAVPAVPDEKSMDDVMGDLYKAFTALGILVTNMINENRNRNQ